MVDAVIGKQIVITVDNQVGALAEASRVLSNEEVNLRAACAHVVNNRGVIVLVSDDNDKAMNVLGTRKYDVREEEVIIVTLDNKPGSLKAITEKIAQAGIDLNLVYGSVVKGQDKCTIIFRSPNNAAALKAMTGKEA